MRQSKLDKAAEDFIYNMLVNIPEYEYNYCEQEQLKLRLLEIIKLVIEDKDEE